jgi:polar amino acid transport system substrate-binding protein
MCASQAPGFLRRCWHRTDFLFALTLLAVSSHAAEAPALTLEIAMLDNAPQGAVAAEVLRVAYGRLGVSFRTQTLPLRRGIQLADSGELDGDLIHTVISQGEWLHLVTVKVPVARVNFMAYKLGPTCPDRVSVEELISGRVAYMRGSRGLELILPESSRQASVNNWDALRTMRGGITRYAVTGQLDSDIQLARRGIDDVCKVREPVLKLDLFHSLNQRHAELAARLEQVLATMQARGEIEKIWADQAAQAKQREGAPQR